MRRLLQPFFCAALTVALAAPALAQSPDAPRPRPIAQVNLNDLVAETQKISDEPTMVELVWWLPPQFWERSLMDSDLSATEQREMVALFRDHLVVAVVQGEMGNFGMKGFSDEAALRAGLRLVDANGKREAPMAKDDVDAELALLFTVARPIMASIIGPMGQNMQLFAFPGTDAAGKPRADALANGSLRFELGRTPFTFETPLPSLLMPMYDGATGKEFPGTFRFNPYTGAPLQATPVKKK